MYNMSKSGGGVARWSGCEAVLSAFPVMSCTYNNRKRPTPRPHGVRLSSPAVSSSSYACYIFYSILSNTKTYFVYTRSNCVIYILYIIYDLTDLARRHIDPNCADGPNSHVLSLSYFFRFHAACIEHFIFFFYRMLHQRIQYLT